MKVNHGGETTAENVALDKFRIFHSNVIHEFMSRKIGWALIIIPLELS